jgi:diguanylate cyclase (GGDEF)-like protein
VCIVHIDADIDRDPSGLPVSVHGVVQDITARKHAEEQIKHLADYDSLTGLPNRRKFREQFDRALASAADNGTLVALLFIDIDRFKHINDTLGHSDGDELLKKVGQRLSQTLRDGDVVARSATDGNSVARLGGDEFTILVTDVADIGAVRSVAERLLGALQQPVQLASQEVFVTASIGVAVYPQHGDGPDELVRKADIAMYAVKDRGRNGVALYEETMNTATRDRWQIENDLHRALERNELVLHYQPKLDVASGRIVGAEALMRWQRGGELVPPAEFITAAEETGLIVDITVWAIAEACREVARWSAAAGGAVPVSVNISSRHVQRADLIGPVKEALRAADIAPSLLELELTETVLMHNIDRALPLLQDLKQLGVSISIDDFGTGYSSLAYLRRLPIDTLKIDRSFVRDLEDSEDNAAIVGAIIAMARSLKLRVVAEGVETAGQMNRLAGQGCTVMQGWLFAKAVPPADFETLLMRQARPGQRGLVPQPIGRAAGGDAGAQAPDKV